MIDKSIMKTTTVEPLDQITPIAPTENFRKFNVEEHMAWLKEVWGDRVFSADEVREMREAELEGEEG